MANYGRELQMGADIRRRDKVEKTTEFVKRVRRVQEEVGAALRKAQDEMRRQADRGRQEVEKWKKSKKIMLSTKDLVFKGRLAKKLTERYMGLYEIKKVVSRNTIKLKLPALMRIHLVVNVSRIVKYKEPVKGQKIEELKPVEVEEVEKQKVKKILNKKKIQGIKKYLVCQKGFIVENDTWEKEKNLENTRELVNEFEGKLSVEVKRQKGIEERWRVKLNLEADNFRRSKLLGKYITKMLYEQDNKKFKEEYLKKLERNWDR